MRGVNLVFFLAVMAVVTTVTSAPAQVQGPNVMSHARRVPRRVDGRIANS